LTYEDFNRISVGHSRAASFLKQLLPFYFRAHHQFLGMEGIWLREVVALAAVVRPDLFRLQSLQVDVELQGELTRGMTVFRAPPAILWQGPNASLGPGKRTLREWLTT